MKEGEETGERVRGMCAAGVEAWGGEEEVRRHNKKERWSVGGMLRISCRSVSNSTREGRREEPLPAAAQWPTPKLKEPSVYQIHAKPAPRARNQAPVAIKCLQQQPLHAPARCASKPNHTFHEAAG